LPASRSAAKRQRQNEKRRLRNKIFKSRVGTYSKKFLAKIEGGSREEAESAYRDLSGLLDRAVCRGVYHRNTVGRKKSRMHRLISNMK